MARRLKSRWRKNSVSLAHVGKSIAGAKMMAHATEENEQAKANEDVANPVREDDDDDEEERREGGGGGGHRHLGGRA
eukprot:jgi/Tetstr1/460935/TSEL_006087.t1